MRQGARAAGFVAVVLLVVVGCCEAGNKNKLRSSGGTMNWYDVIDSAKLEALKNFFHEREVAGSESLKKCLKEKSVVSGLFDCLRIMKILDNSGEVEDERVPCSGHSDCSGDQLCCLSSASEPGWTSCMRPNMCGLSRGELDRGIIMKQNMYLFEDTSDGSQLKDTFSYDNVPVLLVENILSRNKKDTQGYYRKIQELEKSTKGLSTLLLRARTEVEKYKESLKDPESFMVNTSGHPESWTVYGHDPNSSDIIAAQPHDQGGCGNCFAFAVATAMSERLYRKTQEDITGGFQFKHPFNTFFSPQQIAERYNKKMKSTSGGNVILALRTLSESSTLLPDFCHPYSCFNQETVLALEGMISSHCNALELPGTSIHNPYDTLTGTFGDGVRVASRAKTILQSEGALVVGIKYWGADSDSSEFYAQDGDILIPTKFQPGDTNHAIVLVGWGEQESVVHPGRTIKYWLLQNSHGDRGGTSHWVKFYQGPIDCELYGSECALDLLLAVGSTPISEKILGGKEQHSLVSNIAAPILPVHAINNLSKLSKACADLQCMNGGIIARDSEGACSCVCDNGFDGPTCESKSILIYTGEDCAGMIAVTLKRSTTPVHVKLVHPDDLDEVVESFIIDPLNSGFRNGNTFYSIGEQEKLAGLMSNERAMALMDWETTAGVYTMKWQVGFIHDNAACAELFG